LFPSKKGKRGKQLTRFVAGVLRMRNNNNLLWRRWGKMDFTGRRKSPHPKRILAGGGGTVPLEPIVEMRVGLTSQLHGGNYQLFNLLPPAAMGANHLQELSSQQHPEPIITITKVLAQAGGPAF
jgi:hypothetical protein